MTRAVLLRCDGCGRETDWPGPAMPADWRRLTVRHGNRNWTLDVCGPHCASKAVDSTYVHEDRLEALRVIR